MTAPFVAVESRGEVAILRLDRPPANAICLEMARDLGAALENAALTGARALVVTGTGRFFSGGLDLREVPGYSREEQREFLGMLNRAVAKLYGWPAPVVAAVNGHAIAGALILVLATDYRVGPEGEAQFGLTEARVGIPFPAVPMLILAAECAPADVRYAALHSARFGAAEAQRRGMLDELRPAPDVLGRALDVARDMAGMPADAYRRVKQQVRGATLARIAEMVEKGADPMLAGWIGPEATEASAAVLKAPRRP